MVFHGCGNEQYAQNTDYYLLDSLAATATTDFALDLFEGCDFACCFRIEYRHN